MGAAAQQRILAWQVALQGGVRAGRALGGQNRHLWGPQECELPDTLLAI